MGDFRIKELESGKIKVVRQETLDLYDIKWRVGSSRTVGKRDVSKAKSEIDDFIDKHKDMTLDELYTLYPKQYTSSLDKNDSDESSNKPLTLIIQQWSEYLDSVNKYSPSSRRQMINIVRRHVKLSRWESVDVRVISAKMINDLIITLNKEDNKSSSTLNQYRRSWKRFFDFCYNKAIRDDNPLAGYVWRAPDTVKDNNDKGYRIFSEYQLELLYHELDNGLSTDWQRRRALQLMIDTGIRSSEAVLLNNHILQGAFSLSAEIVDGSELQEYLDRFYFENRHKPLYKSIIDALMVDYGSINTLTRNRIVNIDNSLSDLDDREMRIFMNTIRFLIKYKSVKSFNEFGFVNVINYKDDDATVSLDQFALNNDLIFLADILPDSESQLIIDDTLIKIEDLGSTTYQRKGAAKSQKSTGRAITLNHRARSTIVKIYRDWYKYAKYKQPIDNRYYYLSDDNGTWYNNADLRYTLKKAIKSLNEKGHRLPELSPHNLRHSFASIRVNQCRSLNELRHVSDELGHTSTEFTQAKYYHQNRPLPSAGLSNIH